MAEWPLVLLAVTALLWAAAVAVLAVSGRRSPARALAGFVPDCAVLLHRLLAEGRLPRAQKLAVAGLLAYLALPIDLVPDVIPVAGQLDDAVIVALVLRALLRGGGPALVREHWPGPPASLAVILRLMGGGTGAVAPAPHAESGGDDRP
jgi:uncharacterized membrane protein YkvA (DUF1232 family)